MSHDHHDPELGCGILLMLPPALLAWYFIIKGIRRYVRSRA